MKISALSLLTCAVLAGSAHGSLIVSEDFNYPTGALGTANGGTGWVGAYTAGNGTVTAGNLDNAANPFAPVGNYLATSGGVNTREFSSTPLIGRDSNETLYFSFMLNPTSVGTNPGRILQLKDIGNGYNHVEVGFNEASQWSIGGGYGSGGGGTGTTSAAGSGTGAGAAFATGQSFFVVGKVVTSSTLNDMLFVQIYGSTGIVSTTDTLSTSNLLNFSVNRTGAGTGSTTLNFNTNGGGAAGAIDGFRMGTDYASVAIPEPSTWALLALGLTAVALRRRRA